MGKKTKVKDNLTNNANKTCKWCTQGSCWTHGQIPRDPAYTPPTPTNVKQTGVKKEALKQSAQATSSKTTQPQMMQMLAHMLQSGMSNPQQAAALMQMLQQGGGGSTQNAGDNSKELLNQWVAKLTGKNPTKDEIIYNTMEIPDSKPTQYISHLVLLSVDPSKTYGGQPSPSKKAAEMSAVHQALQENGQSTGQVQAAGVGTSKNSSKKKKKKKNTLVQGGEAGMHTLI